MKKAPHLRGFIISKIGDNAHADNFIRIINRAVLSFAAFDKVDKFHARSNFAPDRILAVQPRAVGKADEKLAVAGIRVHGPCHRNRAALMRVAVKFRFQLFAGAAGTVAVGQPVCAMKPSMTR